MYSYLKKDQFLDYEKNSLDSGHAIYSQAEEIPEWLRDAILGVSHHGKAFDYYTPLKNGKDWLFELTEKYQPRTGAILLSGSELHVRQLIVSGRPLLFMMLEVKGKVVLVNRAFYGSHFGDANYLERRHVPERCESLPPAIRDAYYNRFDGLNIPSTPSVGIYTRLLPFPVHRPWQSWDGYLEEFRGYKKKYLPWLEERIPNVKPESKYAVYTKFMMFLDTRSDLKGKEGDVLFVKNHIQDGLIYHIKDADIENMRILENPEEAIDRYCEHVLLEKEGRFDFLQYGKKL